MSRMLPRLIRRVLALWMDFWLLFPVLLSLYLVSIDTLSLFTFFGSLLGSFSLALVFRSITRKHKRIFAVLFAILLSIIVAVLLGQGIADRLLTGVLLFIAALRGIAVSEYSAWGDVFPRVYYFTGLFLYFIAYFLYSRLPWVQEYQGYIVMAGLIATVSSLFMINSDVLMEASRSDLENSTSLPVIRKNNRFITVVLLLLIMLITSYHTLKEHFLRIMSAVFFFLIRLIDIIMGYLVKPIVGEPGPGDDAMPFMPPMETEAANPFWENVIYIISYIILALLVIFFLKLVLQGLFRGYRYLVRLIKRFLSGVHWEDVSGGFHDEKESLMDWQSLGQNYANNLREWLERLFKGEPKWEDLENDRQRVRYLYRHLLLRCIARGYSFKASFTPQETMNDLLQRELIHKRLFDGLKRLYGQARYGTGPLESQDVEALRGLATEKKSGIGEDHV